MDSKLTLSLNKDVIEKAKIYAQSRNISLSRLIENFLLSISSKISPAEEITAYVKSLSGIIEEKNTKNYRKSYSGHLAKKYK